MRKRLAAQTYTHVAGNSSQSEATTASRLNRNMIGPFWSYRMGSWPFSFLLDSCSVPAVFLRVPCGFAARLLLLLRLWIPLLGSCGFLCSLRVCCQGPANVSSRFLSTWVPASFMQGACSANFLLTWLVPEVSCKAFASQAKITIVPPFCMLFTALFPAGFLHCLFPAHVIDSCYWLARLLDCWLCVAGWLAV